MDRQAAPGGVGMFGPAHHGLHEIAMVEIDLERRAREIGGSELERRLRQIDAVIVADLGSAQRGLHHAGVAAGDVEEGKRRRKHLVQGVAPDAADLAMGEIVARDELAVGGPLLLELRERAGVHHRAARFELMDMNVDHLRGLSNERLPTGWIGERQTPVKAASYESIRGTKGPAVARRT